MAPLGLPAEIEHLAYDYVECLDDGRLEAWPELFVEDGVYKIVSRENTDRGLSLPIWYCDGRAMMHDRVLVFRNALIYSFRFDRHMLSNLRVVAEQAGTYSIRAHFVVYQTDPEGRTEFFCSGRYDDQVVLAGGAAKFKEKIVTVDTFAIPNMISAPL